jgi:hypothetical protein
MAIIPATLVMAVALLFAVMTGDCLAQSDKAKARIGFGFTLVLAATALCIARYL